MAKQMTNGEREDIQRLVHDARRREIQQLESADPEWQARIAARTRKIAIGQLKVDKESAELAKIDAEIAKLKARREDVETAISRKMPKQEQRRGSCPMPMDFCDAVSQIVLKLTPREQAKDVTGKKVDAVNLKYQKRLELLATCETRSDVLKHGIIG